MLITRCVPGSLSESQSKSRHAPVIEGVSFRLHRNVTYNGRCIVPLKHSTCLRGSLSLLRQDCCASARRTHTTARSALFRRAEAKQLAGSAPGCFGDELWFGAPNRRRTPRFGDENLPQTTSVHRRQCRLPPTQPNDRQRNISSIISGCRPDEAQATRQLNGEWTKKKKMGTPRVACRTRLKPCPQHSPLATAGGGPHWHIRCRRPKDGLAY